MTQMNSRTLILCPKCGSSTKVSDSRNNKTRNVARRRRVCLNHSCQHRVTTYEFPSTGDVVDMLPRLKKLRNQIADIFVQIESTLEQFVVSDSESEDEPQDDLAVVDEVSQDDQMGPRSTSE